MTSILFRVNDSYTHESSFPIHSACNRGNGTRRALIAQAPTHQKLTTATLLSLYQDSPLIRPYVRQLRERPDQENQTEDDFVASVGRRINYLALKYIPNPAAIQAISARYPEKQDPKRLEALIRLLDPQAPIDLNSLETFFRAIAAQIPEAHTFVKHLQKQGQSRAEEMMDWFETHQTLLDGISELDLSDADLEEVPRAIGYCRNLTGLLLRNNRLKTLPTELFLLRQIDHLEINGNPGLVIPWSLSSFEKLNLEFSCLRTR